MSEQPVAPAVPVVPVEPATTPPPVTDDQASALLADAVAAAEAANTGGQQPPVKTDNPWADPAAAQAEIERLRRENGKDRTTAKAAAAEQARNELAQTIGRALGLVKDEPVDPVKLTEQLTAEKVAAQQARVELAVFRAAGGTADPSALLDSRTFLASVHDIDPDDTTALTAAITAAVQANPRLGAAPQSVQPRLPAPNPAQGSSANGAPSAEAQADAEYDRYFPPIRK